MRETLQSLINDAIETFEDEYLCEWRKYPEDDIAEIADGSVPVYHSELLELASDNWDLLLTEPDCGPAYDGTPTPINIVAANVYEAVSSALYQWWYEHEDEIREGWEDD
jgi:hypothetical protein